MVPGRGATTSFDEFLTVFNPTNVPLDVTVDLFGTSGVFTPHTVPIPTGPGRFKVAVRDWIGSQNHATRVTARRTAAGALAPIVVERTMQWEWVAGQPEGHSTPGVSALSSHPPGRALRGYP